MFPTLVPKTLLMSQGRPAHPWQYMRSHHRSKEQQQQQTGRCCRLAGPPSVNHHRYLWAPFGHTVRHKLTKGPRPAGKISPSISPSVPKTTQSALAETQPTPTPNRSAAGRCSPLLWVHCGIIHMATITGAFFWSLECVGAAHDAGLETAWEGTRQRVLGLPARAMPRKESLRGQRHQIPDGLLDPALHGGARKMEPSDDAQQRLPARPRHRIAADVDDAGVRTRGEHHQPAAAHLASQVPGEG